MAVLPSESSAFSRSFCQRFFAPERLECWLDGRWGRMLHLRKGDISRACGWFDRHGKSAVFFCRCVPIVRSLISIPAGMAKMKMGQFLLLTTIGSLIWNTSLVYLGVVTGASWGIIIKYLDTYSIITFILLSLIAMIFCIIFYNKRFKGKNSIK